MRITRTLSRAVRAAGVADAAGAFALVLAGVLAACDRPRDAEARAPKVAHTATSDSALASGPRPDAAVNIYAHAGANMLSPTAARAKPLVYVPNSRGASVTVIDPATYRVVRTFATGTIPQHVVPAYDMSRLWVLNNASGSLTPIDPVTGEAGPPVRVDDPYNLYYTPDGTYAIVVAEARHRLDFRDPRTMRLARSVRTDCRGIDHMDFTTDGRYLIATCEFSGHLIKLDLDSMRQVGYLALGTPDVRGTAPNDSASMPQDVRASPDGKVFYVADMVAGGVHLVDPVTFTRFGFIKTGVGAHGLYPSRDGKLLYVTNRGWNTLNARRHGRGSITVIDPEARKVVATWPIPGGGSPDMGNVTADGRELWITGRYDDEVYVFDTATGVLTHRIHVGREPHGLCVWPQPGRVSLGHTGNMR